MAAFRLAVQMGARFIETDLRLTRDARLVALHDDTVDRTTSGKGAVKDLSLAELRAFDAGSWFDPRFAGERIPTLDELLEFARQTDVIFYLEVKAMGTWGGEHALVAALREAGETARTVVLSFDPVVLLNVHRFDASVMTGLLLEDTTADPVERALAVGARQLAPRGELVTPELLTAAHRHGLPVVPWTVNDEPHMRALAAAGVDGIMTDYPDRLIRVLRGL